MTFTEDQRINLPREMWIEIWSFLDFKTLQKTCTLVSKTWFEEIRNSTRLSGEMTLKTSWPWWNVKGYFFDKEKNIYRTRAIITRGLYSFYPLFGVQKRAFFLNFWPYVWLVFKSVF